MAHALENCLSRRLMLQRSAAGFGALALRGLMQASETPNPLAAKNPHFQARAKRVIFLFMKGGPSHVDTFDPKPLLDRDHGKPLPFALPRVTFAKTSTLLKSPWKPKVALVSIKPTQQFSPEVLRRSHHFSTRDCMRSARGETFCDLQLGTRSGQ